MSTETEYKNEDPKYFMDEVYKQWHRRGFISVRLWPHAEKVQIEIASIDQTTKKTTSVSKAYIETFKFITYLDSEMRNTSTQLYPEFGTKGLQFFGGSANGGQAISRVLTVGPYRASKDAPVDLTKRSFRCANYNGKQLASGAIEPIYSEVISFDHIQMTFAQIAELYHSLTTATQAYAVQKADKVDIYGIN